MSEETALLKDILSTLREIRDVLRSGGGGGAVSRSSTPSNGSSGGGDVASDRELDGQYGNPAVRKDPKRWDGPSYVGCLFSECPADYLDAVASFKDWQAGKDEETGAVDAKGRPKSQWARKDAKLARGWADRVRNGWKAAPADESSRSAPADQGNNDYGGAGAGDDDIPF